MKEVLVESGRLAVGDPCYDDAELSVPALNGSWRVRAQKIEGRVASVLVHHESFDPIGRNYRKSVEYIGVDSGQAGVWDSDSFKGGDDGDFYETCCRATVKYYGFVPGGFVSSCGYGDGGYPVRIHSFRGKAEAVEIVFIRKD